MRSEWLSTAAAAVVVLAIAAAALLIAIRPYAPHGIAYTFFTYAALSLGVGVPLTLVGAFLIDRILARVARSAQTRRLGEILLAAPAGAALASFVAVIVTLVAWLGFAQDLRQTLAFGLYGAVPIGAIVGLATALVRPIFRVRALAIAVVTIGALVFIGGSLALVFSLLS